MILLNITKETTMADNKSDLENKLDALIEVLQGDDIEHCAVVVLTKNGQLRIGSYNIEEIDVIELFQRTANFMIDETGASFTIH